MLNQLSNIVLDFFIILFLSIDKPSKEWIVVPLINKATFAIYVVMGNLFSLFVFKKNFLNSFDDLCFACTYNTPYVL